MRQSAVILARVLGFIEFADLVSGTKVSTAELVRKVTERFSFQKSPKTIEELDLHKGIEFVEGVAGVYPIKKFVIWDTLLTLETQVNTSVSRTVLEEILLWGAKEFGLHYSPGSIKRFAYISDVTFFSDAPILDVNPAVKNLAFKCSDELSHIWQEPVRYEPFTVRVGHDPSARKYPIAPFMIEHRAETRFSENKYFSEAPLPTDIHLRMLEEFEQETLLHGKTGNA
ncbi:MAG TPA: hypothetical protein VGC07_05940 [Granulicella sp.]